MTSLRQRIETATQRTIGRIGGREQQIAKAKKELGERWIQHKRAMDRFDCGVRLAQHVSVEISENCRRINELAAWLTENDPSFPKNWTPL